MANEIVIAKGLADGPGQEAKLKAAGVKSIYRADKGQIPGVFKMRKGELLGVAGFDVFGESRKAIVEAIDLVHSWGAAIVDVEQPGLRSDRDGARMLHIAMTPRRLSPEEATRMQANGVAARIAGRMPENEARSIWFDSRYSVKQKVKMIHGWSERTLYDNLGKTNALAGPKPAR